MRKIFFTVLAFFSFMMSAHALEIQSSDFKDGQLIPKVFTCMGANLSPALSWQGEPEGTVSFALICEDPDAPSGIWTHWIILNLPASIHALSGGISADVALPGDAQQGLSSFQKIGYGGPCPPLGQKHRYQFKLYALDLKLELTGAPTRGQLLAAIEGHVLAEACLTGLFKR